MNAYNTRRGIALLLLTGTGLLFCGEQLLDCSHTRLASLPESKVAQHVKRLEPLRKNLPSHATVGYLTDQPDNVVQYYLTQYTLAPLVVERSVANDPVIGNFLGSDIQPVLKQYPQFVFFKDLGDGVVLLSRFPRKAERGEKIAPESRPDWMGLLWGGGAIILAGLSGFFFVRRFCGEMHPGKKSLVIVGPLALGFGWGLSSLSYFLCLSLWGAFQPGLILVEVLFVGLLIIWTRRTSSFSFPVFQGGKGESRWLFSALLLCGVLGSGYCFIQQTILLPHGGWDAWAIWNLHARFLARGEAHWSALFSDRIGWTHPDYPLLLSAAIARCWSYIGEEPLWVPLLVNGCFLAGTVGLLFGGLLWLRGYLVGCFAAVILLGTPSFISQGAMQIADIPLAFFFLATLVLLTLYDSSKEQNAGYLLLAGLMAGCAAWTKNEGLAFVVVVTVVRGLLATVERGWQTGWQSLAPFLAGVAPIVLVLAWFKLGYAPPNDIVGQDSISRLSQIMDVERYGIIAPSFVRSLLFLGHLGQWKWLLFPVLLVYLCLVGISVEETQTWSLFSSASIVAIMLVIYFLVYLISPYDLRWHLTTSLDRLIVQLWPSILLLFFLLARQPIEQTNYQPTNAPSKISTS